MGGKKTTTSEQQTSQTQDELLQSIVQQLQQSTQNQTQNQQSSATGTSSGTSSSTGQQTTQTTGQNQQQTQQQQQGTGQVTSTTNLAPGQQPNVDLLLAGARDAYAAGGTDPLQAQARQQAVQYAQGTGSNLVGQALSADQSFLDPSKIYNVAGDQNYQQLSSALTAQANKNLLEQILPQVRAGAVATGNLGGSADAILQGQAIGNSNAGLTQALAGLADNTVNRNLAAYQAAQGRVGTNYNLGLAPSSTVEAAGAANIADRNSVLALLQQLTGQAGTYGGTNTQQTQQQGTSTGVSTGTATDTSQATSSQAGTQQQTQQQDSTSSMQSQIDEVLQRLGLTDTASATNASGTSTSTNTSKTSLSPLQILGSVLSIATGLGWQPLK